MREVLKNQVRQRLEQMLYELKAINAWNEAYGKEAAHDFIETAGHEARHRRTSELLHEFIELTMDSST
jgi:hypothetical protein